MDDKNKTGSQLQAAAPSDLQQLKALALAYTSTYNSWFSKYAIADGITDEDAADFIVAASPAVVLNLIARIGHLNEALKVANDCLAGRPAAATLNQAQAEPTPQAFLAAELPAAEPVYRVSDFAAPASEVSQGAAPTSAEGAK